MRMLDLSGLSDIRPHLSPVCPIPPTAPRTAHSQPNLAPAPSTRRMADCGVLRHMELLNPLALPKSAPTTHTAPILTHLARSTSVRSSHSTPKRTPTANPCHHPHKRSSAYPCPPPARQPATPWIEVLPAIEECGLPGIGNICLPNPHCIVSPHLCLAP
jgi:hypothetical protein